MFFFWEKNKEENKHDDGPYSETGFPDGYRKICGKFEDFEGEKIKKPLLLLLQRVNI